MVLVSLRRDRGSCSTFLSMFHVQRSLPYVINYSLPIKNEMFPSKVILRKHLSNLVNGKY